MASLGDMYARALADELAYQRGWVPNWPPSFPLELGRVGELVYSRDTRIVSLEGNNKLTDYGVTPGPPEDGPVTGPRTFSCGSETKVEIGVEAKVPGWEWLGNARAGFKASFGREGGLQAQADNPQHHGLPNTDGLRNALRKAGENHTIPIGKSIVIELETADKAMIVASESSAGALQVSTSVDIEPTGIKLATFALNHSIRAQSGKAVVAAYPNRITTAFKALTVGFAGIWFWRRIDVFVEPIWGDTERAQAVMREQKLTPDDYYVMY